MLGIKLLMAFVNPDVLRVNNRSLSVLCILLKYSIADTLRNYIKSIDLDCGIYYRIRRLLALAVYRKISIKIK